MRMDLAPSIALLQEIEKPLLEAAQFSKFTSEALSKALRPSPELERLKDALNALQPSPEFDRLKDALNALKPYSFSQETIDAIKRASEIRVHIANEDKEVTETPKDEEISGGKDKENATHDHIVYDSSNEQNFATDLDTNTDVAVYVKLPDGFYISTPVGKYNPDWAIAFYKGSVKHIYFVAETKGSMSSMQLRLIEESKIHCAREHFKAISGDDVVYDVVDSYQALLNKVMR